MRQRPHRMAPPGTASAVVGWWRYSGEVGLPRGYGCTDGPPISGSAETETHPGAVRQERTRCSAGTLLLLADVPG